MLDNNWIFYLRNFITQFLTYVNDRDEKKIEQLLIHNFSMVTKNLQNLHSLFDELFLEMPDYFQIKKLNDEEDRLYISFKNLLNIWINDFPSIHINNVNKYVEKKIDYEKTRIREHLKESCTKLTKKGIEIFWMDEIYYDYPLKYLPIIFSVQEQCFYDEELVTLFLGLAEIDFSIDFFCLIPLNNNSFFIDGAYQVSPARIRELVDEGNLAWESLVPLSLPDEVQHLIPDLQFDPSDKFMLQQKILSFIGSVDILLKKIKLISSIDRLDEFESKLYQFYEERIDEVYLRIKEESKIIVEELEKLPPNNPLGNVLLFCNERITDLKSLSRTEVHDVLNDTINLFKV